MQKHTRNVLVPTIANIPDNRAAQTGTQNVLSIYSRQKLAQESRTNYVVSS